MTVVDWEQARERESKLSEFKRTAEKESQKLKHNIGKYGNGWKRAPDGRRFFTYCRNCEWMCIVDGAKDAPTGKVLVEECRGKSRR